MLPISDGGKETEKRLQRLPPLAPWLAPIVAMANVGLQTLDDPGCGGGDVVSDREGGGWAASSQALED